MRPVTVLRTPRDSQTDRDRRASELHTYLDRFGESCATEINLDFRHWTRAQRRRATIDLLNAGSVVMTEHDEAGGYHLFHATQPGAVVDLDAWRGRAA